MLKSLLHPFARIRYNQTERKITMPHDANGQTLKAGDRVTMEFEVTEVTELDNYCNISLESVLPIYPGTGKTALHAVNSRQVILVVPETQEAQPEVDEVQQAQIAQNQQAAGVSLADAQAFQQSLAESKSQEEAVLSPSDLVPPSLTHAQLNAFVHDIHARVTKLETDK